MKEPVRNGYYRSRSRKMALTIIAVSLAPMLLVSGIILYQFRNAYEEKIDAHLLEVVEKHRQSIDMFLKDKLADIRMLATSHDYEELVDEVYLKNLLAQLLREYGPIFVDLGVISAEGLQTAYAGPFPLEHADYSRTDWFREAQRREYFISDVFLGIRKLPHFIIAVRNTAGGKPWILRATIDFQAFNNLVEKIRIGETGFAFILNRTGAFQTRPFEDIRPDEAPYLAMLGKREDPLDETRIVKSPDGAGTRKIHLAAYLKEGEWVLVYQQDVADAFSQLNKAHRAAVAILLLGGFGIVSTALFVSRRIFRRFERSDQEKEMMSEQMVQTGKLASVGELAAGIAHEINNPVAIMVEEAGWIEDLLEEEDLRSVKNLEEFKRALHQIRNQGKRCKEITHKLLSFARKTDATVQEVQLNDLIEEVVSLSAQRARYSNVTIHTDLEESLPTLSISKSEIQQVFLNLINNAIDAMDRQGGTIDIATRAEEDSVTIFVADTGPGIPRANLDRVFDPFFTTKPVGKGTGLGLSICYGIIKKLGGEIDVRSVIEVGTTFRIRLPREKWKTESRDSRSEQEGGAQEEISWDLPEKRRMYDGTDTRTSHG